jgi:hypothetical protein
MFAIIATTDGKPHDCALTNTREEAATLARQLYARHYADRIDVVETSTVEELLAAADHQNDRDGE